LTFSRVEVVLFVLAVVLYFLLACLVSWLALFPAGRAYMLRQAGRAEAAMQRRFAGLRRTQTAGAHVLRQSGAASAHGLAAFAKRHYLLCLGALVLLSVPPMVAFMVSGKNMLGAYDVSTREVNTQVAGLLQGEELVPPVALPPTVFATAEIERERPMLVSASRNWTLMDAEYTQRLLLVFKIMKEQHGYDMAILEGYRSPERQNVLASMGGNVTNAAAFQSWHQYGLAADCAFLRDGKLVITEKDPWAMRGYELYGQVAESVGLTWGGRWKMMDFGHTELRVPGVMKRKG
jgi:peptidoglycan L-alanyl-D-glutamate endopeptidase CwlK